MATCGNIFVRISPWSFPIDPIESREQRDAGETISLSTDENERDVNTLGAHRGTNARLGDES